MARKTVHAHSAGCTLTLTSASARADSGVSSEGLIKQVQPAARAAEHLRNIMAMGKFQGVMRADTPTGCLVTMERLPFIKGGRVSPYVLLASSANHSMKDAPYTASARDSAIGLPCNDNVLRILADTTQQVLLITCV